MPRCLSYTIVLSLGIFCPSVLLAQKDSSNQLPSVEVLESAKKYPFIASISTTGPTFVVDESKINDLGARDIGEIMKFIPSVQVKDYGGIGGMKTLNYRSLGGTHTGLEIDMSTQFDTQVGTLNLSSAESFGARKVVFTSGQPSNPFTLASSFIPANLISVTTNQFYFPERFNFGLYQIVTSINSYESGFRLSSPFANSKAMFGAQIFAKYGNGRYPYISSLSGSQEALMRSNSELLNYRGRMGLGYKFSNSRLNISMTFNKSDQELPGAVILYNPSNDQELQQEDFRTDINYFGTAKANSKLSINGLWTYKVNAYAQSNKTNYFDPSFLNAQGYIRSSYRQRRYGSGAVFTKSIRWLRLRLGSDLYYADLMSNEFANSPSRLGVNSIVSAEIKMKKKYNIQFSLSHQFLSDEARSSDSLLRQSYSELAPFIGFNMSHQSTKSLIGVNAFYKRVYRIPTFNELYYNFIGNSNLLPEDVHLTNVGFNWLYDLSEAKKSKKSRIEFSVNGFYNHVKNKIVAIPTKDLFNWSMQNIGITQVAGFDLSTVYYHELGSWNWDFTIGGTYNYSVDRTDKSSPSYGHQIPYTPRFSGSAGFSVGWKGLSFTNNLLLIGERYSLNENIPINYLEPYVDWNLGISKKFEFNNMHTIFGSFKVMNVLNRNYQIIRSFPMPGRYYQLTLKYSFL